MNKIRTIAIASLVAVGGGISPVTAVAQAHGPVRQVLHYCSDFACQNETGQEIYYCDEHVEYVGRPEAYSYSDYYQC
jgi:hypothetical protein